MIQRSPLDKAATRVRTRRLQPLARGVLVAALGAFAGTFAVVKANRSAALDVAITLKLQRYRSRLMAGLMRAVSWPGFPPQSRVIPPLIVAAWWLAGRPRAAAFQLAAWGGALLSTAVKATVRRERPLPPEVEVVVAPLGGTSFPSGHVLTYVGFYGFLAYLIAVEVRTPVIREAAVGGLAALLATVGPSRIQQGHHWATDVAASYFLGVAFLLGLVELYGRGTGGVLEELAAGAGTLAAGAGEAAGRTIETAAAA